MNEGLDGEGVLAVRYLTDNYVLYTFQTPVYYNIRNILHGQLRF